MDLPSPRLNVPRRKSPVNANKTGVEMDLPLPRVNVLKPTNPYRQLPMHILNRIIQVRDIMVPDGREEKIQMLHQLDQIMPDWIGSIFSASIASLHVLDSSKVYVFGALRGVDYRSLPDLSDRDIITYTRLSIMDGNNMSRLNPNMFRKLLGSAKRNILIILAKQYGLTDDHARFVSTPELIRVILTRTCTILDFGRIDRLAERYHLIDNHPRKRTILELYHPESLDEIVQRTTPHPLEEIILHMDEYTTHQLHQMCQMIVPFATENIETYVQDNVVNYAPLFVRLPEMDFMTLETMAQTSQSTIVEFLKLYTDHELFGIFDVYVRYVSRPDLIRQLVSTIRDVQFMIPLDRKRSKNEETVMFTPVDNPEVFMICYGTCMEYYTYEVQDLYHAFHHDDNGMFRFRKPEDTDQVFTIKEMERLSRLLECYPDTEGVPELIERIKAGIIELREQIESDIQIDHQFRQIPSDHADIHSFLHQIIAIGMYMRRWEGPGHPYPILGRDTRHKPDPEMKVADELQRLSTMVESMSKSGQTFCKNIKSCEYDGNRINAGNNTFYYQHYRVVNGDLCIRMASTRFIGTGIHYLRVLYKESVPGIDTEQLDQIV